MSTLVPALLISTLEPTVVSSPSWNHYYNNIPNTFESKFNDTTFLSNLPQKIENDFETFIKSMFSDNEKEEFLINLGFTFIHEYGEDWITRVVVGVTEKALKKDFMDKVFLREIIIKFKNLLLAKTTLKLKI